MDKLERMRGRVSREKRKTDDLLNRTAIAKKKQADGRARKHKLDFEKRNEEPFFERMRRTDAEYIANKNAYLTKTRQKRAQAASYKDGTCFIDLLKYTDYAKQDEIKAKEIADKINRQKDVEMANKKYEKMNKLMQTSMSNYQKVKEMG